MDVIHVLDNKLPLKAPFLKILAPMIDVQNDPQNQSDQICHIFHSTLRTFLLKYPGVLSNVLNTNVPGGSEITPLGIAEACLAYLSQNKLATPLQKIDNRWHTSSGEDIEKSHFLTYSAKYWDKHLVLNESFSELSSRVKEFMVSKNFATVLQVQSIFISISFRDFSPRIHQFFKENYRVTTTKFGAHASQSFWERFGGEFRDDYRHFLREWKYFLHRPTCSHVACYGAPGGGEIDRVLWASLGHNNFLNHHTSRYKNFVLTSNSEKKAIASAAGEVVVVGRFWEAPSSDGRYAIVLQLQDAQ